MEAAPGGDQGHPAPAWGHHSFAPLPRRPSSGAGSVSFRGARRAPPDRYLSLSPGLSSLPVPSRPVPHPQRPRTPHTVPISRLPVPTVWLPGPVLLLALCLSYV